MITNSHKTAIARATLPVPTRWLLSQGMLHGTVLDYGCGKCKQINDKVIASTPGVKSVISYDPFYEPDALKNSAIERFDVVICNYVLCTLPIEAEKGVLKDIQDHLLPNGIAFVSVRNDIPRGGYGVSSKGTYQRKVEIEYLYELKKCAQYRIYLLTRDCKLI
jgi:hypothetical protein